MRVKTDLPGVRINDLHHTLASLFVSGSISLPMIGKLAGHTQVDGSKNLAL